ncbi:beta-N-acetylhexosaminidase [Thioalkalivibrio sp. ALgr3]|uniref:beta-N-acetylhexosaminidase n=1 Tax=Thioalkalivibrio sp. ALgr3 TaxID=1239292 RepID=UPI0003733786|nr:beta-N-acetylhexosaminidase [Thioalkalivibrio sp. ALgr3]
MRYQPDPRPPGPVMLDVSGPELKAEDRERLQHPATGGVILFDRNVHGPEQVEALTADMRRLRPELLIAVDQEGGRVQRLREGFTRFPPMRSLGHLHDQVPARARELARGAGELLALELQAVGIDFSFAPVLDRDLEISEVIGDRAFHHDPAVIADLGLAFVRGLTVAGMASVGKHFPGHGAVAADSHVAVPEDPRPLAEIEASDIEAFRPLAGHLEGMMPAHVVYPAVDDRPAGFSRTWLQDILRGRIGFQGAIFSDDLAMAGAEQMGSPAERADAALEAGCDMILICNRPEEADVILDHLADYRQNADTRARLRRMHARAVSDDAQHRTALQAQLHAWLKAGSGGA